MFYRSLSAGFCKQKLLLPPRYNEAKASLLQCDGFAKAKPAVAITVCCDCKQSLPLL